MTRRIAVVMGVAALGLVTWAAPAWAHVTVSPESAERGASDVEITFRVPNEEDSATTKVQIALPDSPGLPGVLAQPVPGWTAQVTTKHLTTPIHTDDGDVSDVVTQVAWTAGSAATGIAPGQFQRFEILVGALPDSGDQLVFKAVQTYAGGDVVRWIDPVTANGPEPERPTPILTLTAPGSGENPTPTTAASGSGSTLPAHVASKSDADSAKTIGIIAIVVAALALAGVGISLARRRPASS